MSKSKRKPIGEGIERYPKLLLRLKNMEIWPTRPALLGPENGRYCTGASGPLDTIHFTDTGRKYITPTRGEIGITPAISSQKGPGTIASSNDQISSTAGNRN